MEVPKSVEIKVGIFVAIGGLVLAVSIILFGGDRSFLTSYYTLRTHMLEVAGLKPGSVVSMSGLVAGNVTELRLVPGTDKIEVVMDIDETYRQRITEGSEIAAKTQGALGDRFLYIEPGPVGGSSIADGGLIPMTEAKDIFAVIEETGPGLSKVTDVISETHQLVKSLNDGGRIVEILDSLHQSSQVMNRVLVRADRLMTQIESGKKGNLPDAVADLANIVRKIDEGRGTLGALVNDPSLHERLMSFLGPEKRSSYIKDLMRTSIQKSEGQGD